MIVGVMLAAFVGLLVIGVPVFIVLIASSLAGFWVWGDIPLTIVPQRLFTGIDAFILIAIPFFVMTGLVMAKGGLANKLLDFSMLFVGKIRGGLAMANVIASMFFAGVTGAASADTASVGSVLIPGMIKKGYHPAFSAAITVTSSTIGVVIPPSIPMVIYGVLTDASIADLFIAGAVPGVIIGSALMIMSYIIARQRDYPTESFLGWKRTVISFFEGLPPLTVIVIIFGGIIGGVFTPTEAAVIAAIYSLVLSLFIYRTLSMRDLPEIFVETATISSLAALLIAASNVFSWLLTTQQVPVLLSETLLSFTDNPLVILLIIMAIYLAIGTVIDLTPAMIILVPIFLPLVQTLGVDVIHFGVITVMALAIGLYTPPVGTCLAVGLAISNVSIVQITRALLPFFVVMVLVLLLIISVPEVSMYLVHLYR